MKVGQVLLSTSVSEACSARHSPSGSPRDSTAAVPSSDSRRAALVAAAASSLAAFPESCPQPLKHRAAVRAVNRNRMRFPPEKIGAGAHFRTFGLGLESANLRP